MESARFGCRRIVLVRMVLNAAVDFLIGLVPFLGDVVDVGFKGNRKNLELFHRHALDPDADTAGSDGARRGRPAADRGHRLAAAHPDREPALDGRGLGARAARVGQDARVTGTPSPLAIGLNLPTWPRADRSYATWPEMRALALDAEAMGVDTLWAPDHLQREIAGERIGFWECWTIVTALAEATTRVGIGPYVACQGFRNPALLAKMAVTLDEVSGGRVVLGLGSGVPARDASWRAFGYDAARPVTRYAESVEVVARMLREGPVTFDGELVRTEDAQVIPWGGRASGPPIWVAGQGAKTAQVAARWGDAINVNLALAGAADMARLTTIAHEACEAVGRDPATLELTGWGRVVLDDRSTALPREGCMAGSPEEVAATVRAFADAGLRHLTIYLGHPDDPSRYPALTPRDAGPVRAAARGDPRRLTGRSAVPRGTSAASRASRARATIRIREAQPPLDPAHGRQRPAPGPRPRRHRPAPGGPPVPRPDPARRWSRLALWALSRGTYGVAAALVTPGRPHAPVRREHPRRGLAHLGRRRRRRATAIPAGSGWRCRPS